MINISHIGATIRKKESLLKRICTAKTAIKKAYTEAGQQNLLLIKADKVNRTNGIPFVSNNFFKEMTAKKNVVKAIRKTDKNGINF